MSEHKLEVPPDVDSGDASCSKTLNVKPLPPLPERAPPRSERAPPPPTLGEPPPSSERDPSPSERAPRDRSQPPPPVIGETPLLPSSYTTYLEIHLPTCPTYVPYLLARSTSFPRTTTTRRAS